MSSFDITSLYTNIRIKKCFNLLSINLWKIKFDSSLTINTQVNICKHITNMAYFKFKNKFFKQKYVLSVGNPLSIVLACLFLEFFRICSFKSSQLGITTYFRYIEDILIFLPQNIKIEEIAQKLNNVVPSINITYEKESNNTIPFLDIVIIKSQNSLTFKIYCKPTNKNNYIHFYSHDHNKIKTGLIIGFYLRAPIICSPQYLNEEFEYI